MDSPHVVVEVPAAGETVARDGTVASFEEAEVRVVAMAVEAVGFALVTEEAGVGRELELSVHAGGDLAAVGLEVRVKVFAIFILDLYKLSDTITFFIFHFSKKNYLLKVLIFLFH